MQSGTELEKKLQEALNNLDKLPQDSTTLSLISMMTVAVGASKILAIREAKKEAQRIQDEFNTYFLLSLKLSDKTYQIGCYHTKELANMIRPIVSEVFENEPSIDWFDLVVHPYKGKIVECPAGLQLEEPGYAITMVETKLTCDVLKNLTQHISSIVEHARILQKNQKEEVHTTEGEMIVIRKQSMK